MKTLILFCVVLPFVCAVESHAKSPLITETPNERVKKDLRYREAFYHYYRKDLFSAIVKLQAERRMNRLPPSAEDIDMQLGGMYMAYGMFDKAEQILSGLTVTEKNRTRLNMEWFYLGKVYYKQNQLAMADRVFERIDKNLPASLRDELNYLRLRIMLEGGRREDAEKLYKKLNDESAWRSYAQFNLGASFVKAGNDSEGIDLIGRVGAIRKGDEELLSLRDKANATLGYYLLRENRFEESRRYFERVRLEGPFSQKALLGLGWAYSSEARYKNALVPWQALAQQNAQDVTVQEALLAMGYALAQLKAERQALGQYEVAIKEYEALQRGLNDAMFEVRNGRVTSSVLSGTDYSDSAITQRLKDVLAAEQGHLLAVLLKKEDFQKAFKDYRDLKVLQSRLQGWKRQLQLYGGAASFSDKNGAEMTTNGGAPLLKPGEVSVTDVPGMQVRIVNMENRLETLLRNYERKLQETMLKELDYQSKYVAHYLSQARYAIAQLLDDDKRGQQ